MLLNNILVQMRERMRQQQAQQGAPPAAATPPPQAAPNGDQTGGLNQLLGMNPMWGAFGQTKLGGMLNGMLGQARVGPAMGMAQNALGRLGLGRYFPGGGQGGN